MVLDDNSNTSLKIIFCRFSNLTFFLIVSSEARRLSNKYDVFFGFLSFVPFGTAQIQRLFAYAFHTQIVATKPFTKKFPASSINAGFPFSQL